MTGLLTDTLHDRADRLEPPALDIAGIIATGDRRRRRQRAGGLAVGACALLVAAGLAIPPLVGGDSGGGSGVDPDRGGSAFATAFAENRPSYAKSSQIHLDGRTFDVGHRVEAYVQTADGVVFADADGVVRFGDGETVTELGRTSAPDLRLHSDDDHVVAWQDSEGDRGIRVYDTATGQRDELGRGQVAGVDDGAIYLVDDGALQRWRPSTDPAGEAMEKLPTEDVGPGFELMDVAGDTWLYTPAGSGDETILGKAGSGSRIPSVSSAVLSPDGTYLVSEESDELHVRDAGSARDLPMRHPDHQFVAGYRWLSDDSFAAIGLPDLRGARRDDQLSIDLLTCSVPEGSCTTSAPDIGTLDDGITIPIGQPLG